MINTDTQPGGSRVLRLVVRLLDVLVLAVVVAVLYVTAVGIPDFLVQRWLRSVPFATYALDVEHVRVSPLRGLVLDDVRVYRRKQIGPALLEARRVVVELSLFDGLMGRSWLQGVELADGTFRPVALRGAGAGGRGGAGRWTGELDVKLENLEVIGAEIEAFEGRLAMDGAAWRLDDGVITARHGARTLAGRGSLAYDREGSLVGSGTAEGDPAVLNVFLDYFGAGVGSRVIRDFAFPQVLPRGEWSFYVPRAYKSGSEVRFQVWLEHPVYKGVQGLRAEGSVVLSWNDGGFTADIRPILAVRDEGLTQGGLTIRTGTHGRVLTFDAVSEFDPRAMAQITGVWTNEANTKFVFEGPYRLAGSGTVNLADPTDAMVRAELAFGRLELGTNELQNCSFQFSMQGASNAIDNLRATWHAGTLTGRAEWYRSREDHAPTSFRCALALANADFAQVASAQMHNSKSEYSGRLHGRLTLEGLAGKAHQDSLRGAGHLSISKGRIFMLPVFGGLSTYLARTIPGLDLVISQSDIQTDFVVERGRIHADKVLVEGDVLSLLGSGSCGLDGSLDFDVQLTFLKSHTLVSKILRVPTYVFSKLFEFRLTGTRKDPRWYPINFSKDLWQRRSVERNKRDESPVNGEPELQWDGSW